uniref:Uncharacterized protein n=1 Tax=Nelumbo nucifera TaxID=4432 RepID=A0A822YZZ5_NELNU|nr:TPA_asm: hypothetical protein HUJ06_013997 [Nelumbo nucifera]
MLCSRKMFSLFIKKDLRKILKHKESDAGEKGEHPQPGLARSCSL